MGVKHVAVVCVAAAVCVGYFGYRHASRTSELRTRQEDNDSRLVQMTLKSPRAGLAEMGSALKRYHADHNAYPDSLASLYPDYISSQPFIHEVQWAYQPGTAGFHLEKSIVRGDQTLVAIIDADLKTRIIGSPHGNHDQRLASAAVDTGRSAREGADGASGSSYEHVKMAIRDADGKSSPEPGPASVAALRFEPVTVSVDPEGGELNGVVAGEVRKTFLVWRDAQGNLGFGNRQYPHAERLGIAAPDSWLILERRPFVGTNPGKAGGWIPDGTATPEDLIKDQGRTLAWKDADGTIGFSNVQYPADGRNDAWDGEKWQAVTSAPSGVDGRAGRVEGYEKAGTPGPPTIGVDPGYLVWKDRSGTLCMGNVQYPDWSQMASVLVNGEWRPMDGARSM